MAFRTSFYLNLTLTFVVLNVTVRYRKLIFWVFIPSESHWDTTCFAQNVFHCSSAVYWHPLMSFDVIFFSIITIFLCIYSFFSHQITWNSWVHSISLPGGDENVLAKGQELRSISSTTQKQLKIVSVCCRKLFFLHSVTRQSERFWPILNLTLPQLISNVNAPHTHQRPPSVGMPRHALRRRIAKYIRTR